MQNRRLRNVQDRPEHAHRDSQNNGIGHYVFQSSQHQLLGVGRVAVVGCCQGENNDGGDVVQGYCSHNHQGGHGGVSVDVVDKGDSQNGGTAAVRCLNDLAPFCPVFSRQGQEKGNADTKQCGKKAEQHEFAVPHCLKICLGQVHEQQYRQQCFKDKLVQLGGGVVVQQSDFFHQTAEYHHEKDRNGGIQTE